MFDDDLVVGGASALWTSSNTADLHPSTNWRNIAIVLRRAVPVNPGDMVIVRSTVRTSMIRPQYQISVSVCRKHVMASTEVLLDAVLFSLPELYPELDAASGVATH